MKRFQLLCLSVLFAAGLHAEQGITMTTGAALESEIRFLVNAKSATQPIAVDFGDGQPVYYTIDPNQLQSNRWITGTVKGKTLRVSGNVTEFSCEEQGIKTVSIEGMTSLDKLILSKNEIEDFVFVDAAPVRFLDLSYNKIENSPSWNANLTLDKVGETLFDLNLSYNPNLRCINMGALKSLVYLSAHDCPQLGSIFICAPEDSHDNLRSVNLDNCDLAHFYPVSLPELRSLSLANNSLVSASYDTDPFVLGDYPKLSSLNVSGNWGISEIDVTECPELQQLHVSECNLSSLDVSQCPELITLSISDNKISALDLGNNKELNNLYVSNNPITNIDFEKLPKVAVVDISGTRISRVDLYYCYYLRSFKASNSLLEFVDFNAQQPERMQLIDLRDCPGFTPLSMAYTVKTLPVARTTQSEATSLFLSGSHPEIADITYATSSDMHWICDSEGDGSADFPLVNATIQDATLSVDRKTGHLERLYPYAGLGLDYDLDVHATDGGRFILAQWEPEWFQTVMGVTTELRRGVPVHVYTYPDEGKQFKSVTVNGKEIFSRWFMVDADNATIRVNFEKKESSVSFSTENGRTLSFCVAAATPASTIEIDWGSGSRTPLSGIAPYNPANIDVVGTRINGKAAGNTVTLYGDITGVDISCYGEVGEEVFGFPNNRISAIDVTQCPDLKLLNLYWNPIKELDVTHNPELEVLDFSYTAVSSVDLSANPDLFYLAGYANNDEIGDSFAQIESIDLSANTALQVIDLHNQRLTSIDVTGCPALASLNLTNNSLSSLDISRNASLVYLRASRNRIQSLDLSGNPLLIEATVDGNELQNLDVSHNTRLEELSVANNNIKAIDTHMLPELGKLYVNGNGLTAEQLNDIYYLLPERKYRPSDDDDMSVKFNLFAVQAADKAPNDGNGADGSIAIARKWLPNPNGNNSGSTTSYIDITDPTHGTFVITDPQGNVITSGSKVTKYTTLTVNATAADGYKYDGLRLNGEEIISAGTFLMPGIYTVVEPVFSTGAGIDTVSADNGVSISVNAAGAIVIEGHAATATVYAADGRTVAIARIDNGHAEIDVPAAGTYIVRVSGNGVSAVKTIVK